MNLKVEEIPVVAVSSDAATAANDVKTVDLFGLDRQRMEAWVESLGEKRFRAKQLLQWIYQRGVLDFEQMTDLSLSARKMFAAHAPFVLPEIVMDRTATDGTRKWLFKMADGNTIETVFIPDGSRGTLCVSSQAGCVLDCSFCATGRQGFSRNLTAGEIIVQVWLANKLLEPQAQGTVPSDNQLAISGLGTANTLKSVARDGPGTALLRAGKRPMHSATHVTNVVMMGMGEPLLNMAALIPSLELMMDDLSFGLSKRKVTVSTSGVVPAMDRLIAAVDCSLAVSLHAPNDTLRDELVPLNRKYPIEQLMGACQRYVDQDRKKHVFFEYVLLAGVNDRPQHAKQLVELLRDFPAKVNLIPFNPFTESGYQRSSESQIHRFQKILNDAGVLTLRRSTRGDDIDAACGQLAGKIEDRSRRHRKFAEPRFGEKFGA